MVSLLQYLQQHETFIFSRMLLDWPSPRSILMLVSCQTQMIEISRTLTLLFLLPLLNADAIIKLEGFTLLLRAALLPVS